MVMNRLKSPVEAVVEFIIEKQAFLRGLYKVQGIVDKKSASTLLANVLVSSMDDNSIQLVATDYDVVLYGTYPVQIIEPGKIAISGRSIFEVVKSLPNLPIQIRSLPSNWIELSCGRAQFKLPGIPPVDFPSVMSDDADIATFQVKKSVIESMIDKTAFSVSNDETRLALNGVLLKVQPNSDTSLTLSMVSTDGHRLSLTSSVVTDSGYSGQGSEAIIHKKGVFELKRMFEGDDEHTNIGFYRRNIVFKNDNDTMFIRQIEESFPDYEKAIPAQCQVSLVLGRQEFVDAIRRVATLMSLKSNIVRVMIHDHQLSLLSNNPDAGEGVDVLDVDYQGPSLSVGFNYRYLLDVLGVLNDSNIRFEITDHFSPGVIRGEADDSSLFVIMPMRI
ncbi:MAG: DNA polymerase III subunit beta [Myxococcales bacterium]|nr:DNA polymerase III subunit beta [Myxococcales bacterium]